MFDGQGLRQSWSDALNDALTAFRGHLTAGQSSSWRRLSAKENATAYKGKTRTLLSVHSGNVVVHKRPTKTGDVYRAVADVSLGDDAVDFDALNAVLVTPELRQEWDPAVESSQTIEMFDPSTKIIKTKFTLGWPANPRDAVLISRHFNETNTIINVSTSLPRSPDEPVYLRPAPPYVRSRVHLLAWCIQLIPSSSQSPSGVRSAKRNSTSPRLRITCFWHHDLNSLWSMGSIISYPQQLQSMIDGLLTTVKKRGSRIAILSGYGNGVSIERVVYDKGRESLNIEYAVTEDEEETQHEALHGLDELEILKRQRRLHRCIECSLPNREGWDIRISTRGSSESVANLPWSALATQGQDEEGSGLPLASAVSFVVKHSPLPDNHSVVKVRVAIEPAGGSKGIRLNGLNHPVEELQLRDPAPAFMPNQLTQDVSSTVDYSFRTVSSVPSLDGDASGTSTPKNTLLLRSDTDTRTAAADKLILARVRRNYIYFSSLLQEPEAKWKRNTEARGVSVTQLDSIDPTLVVYRAEATFVGVGIWDLYSAVMTPGARIFWDKLFDDAILLEDVNDLSELWQYKTKPAWPVTGRDAVCLRTVYKSPTTVHVFAFSVDDAPLFSNIPPTDPNVIRTQVDLQGWSIEALSPNTTLVTLLEQSDPKGWSGKSTIPQQMIANVAGIGEFAIRCGGPPLVTRLSGAKAISSRYDHERGSFRIEYTPSTERNPNIPACDQADDQSLNISEEAAFSEESGSESRPDTIECELRCDLDTWATSLDIIIDPPPQNITCLRRHRLATAGGGLWMTIGHDGVYDNDERLLIIVRRAPVTAGKEKGVVMINGKRTAIDVEDLSESEVKLLAKQKRVKPIRVPLDQPPVFNAIRRQRAEIMANDTSDVEDSSPILSRANTTTTLTTSAPKFPSPLVNFFTVAFEQASTTTQQAVAALSPPTSGLPEESFSTSSPMQQALEALSFAQAYHGGLHRDSWVIIAEKGLQVQRRPSPEISPVIPVHRGEKVIENVIAEDVAAAITSYDCRKRWDERFESATIFEEFGGGCCTAFLVNKGGFPFRGRGFYLATIIAREAVNLRTTPSEASTSSAPSTSMGAIFIVSASFNPESVDRFSAMKYNPAVLPVGRMLIDAWILETLDPYTSENYAIPSTRCTRLVAVDYAGSVPLAFNTMINSALPRSILALETVLKSFTPYPEMRLPSSGFIIKPNEANDALSTSWNFKREDSSRSIVASRFTESSRIFRTNILVSFSAAPICLHLPPEEKTPKPVERAFLSRPSTPDLLSASQRETLIPSSISAPINIGTPSRRRTMSSAAGPRMRSRSRGPRFGTSPSSPYLRPQTPPDFVVAELVVDAKLYPDGYNVRMGSVIEAGLAANQPLGLSTIVNRDLFSSSTSPLPLVCSVSALPPSPFNVANKDDLRAKHLVRVTLPTSHYEAPDMQDLLSGETRSAPAKPSWLRDLEDTQKCVVVHLEVAPLMGAGGKTGKVTVMVNDIVTPVGNESDAKSAGQERDVLTLGILSRANGESSGGFPKELAVPLAIADDLIDSEKLSAASKESTVDEDTLSGSLQDEANESHETVIAVSTPEPMTPVDDKAPIPEVEHSQGILKILNNYQTNLMRYASSSSIASTSRSVSRTASSNPVTNATVTSVGETAKSVVRTATAPRYSLWTLLLVALIAFLVGSLLRSLLSPADFIYVVSDLEDAPARVVGQADGGLSVIEPGWREIKRLLEVKYIVGGWDFQIAMVRRH